MRARSWKKPTNENCLRVAVERASTKGPRVEDEAREGEGKGTGWREKGEDTHGIPFARKTSSPSLFHGYRAAAANSCTGRFDVTTVLHAHSNVPAVRAYSDKTLPATPWP